MKRPEPPSSRGVLDAARPPVSDPHAILITGASGGLGASLARVYAARGRQLLLHGRDPDRLASICAQCEAHGAEVLPLTFDVRETDATVQILRTVSARHPIDLAIVNAGVTHRIGDGEELESPEIAREVLAVNLEGALATIAGVLPAMRARGSGQIALVSSLAALRGLPQAPTYSASKAALKAYGEALRPWLAPQGIAVNVVLPGFIDTRMTSEDWHGPTPGLISAERAALLIQRALARNRAQIAFPRRLALGLRLLALLPQGLAARVMQALGFEG